MQSTTEEIEMTRTFTLIEMTDPITDVTAVDLREALLDNAEHGTFHGRDDQAWRIAIDGEPIAAQAAYVAFESSACGRLGIAWGADAVWVDVRADGIHDAIDRWLNDVTEA